MMRHRNIAIFLISLLLSYTIANELVPNTTDLLSEQDLEEVHTCEISLVARDYFTKPPEHELECIDLEDDQIYGIIPPSTDKSEYPVSGDVVNIRAIRVLNTLASHQIKLKVLSWRKHLFKTPNVHESDTTGRSVVVLILRYTDPKSATGFLGTDMDTSDKRKAVAKTTKETLFGYGTNMSVADAWNSCSYGKTTLVADTDELGPLPNQYSSDFPGDTSDIYYVDVPSVCSTTTDRNCTRNYDIVSACSSTANQGSAAYALNKLEKEIPGFSRNKYQHKVVIFDQSNTACSFVGLGNVGCSASTCFSYVPSKLANKLSVFAHEMGHNLGLSHAGSSLHPNSTDREYGDFSDVMGYCCRVRCYNGPHAFQLGWLPARELSSANIGSVSTSYKLNSMSSTNVDALIAIRADWASGDGNTYWIQLKTADSYDQYLNPNMWNKVQIKQWNKVNNMITLDQGVNLIAGGSWTDPSGRLAVTVRDVSSGSEGVSFATINIGWAGPTALPTSSPVIPPTQKPIATPTPTWKPSIVPTLNPTRMQSGAPTLIPTTTTQNLVPTASPTVAPTYAPSTVSPTTYRSTSISPTMAPTTPQSPITFLPTTNYNPETCSVPCTKILGTDGVLVHHFVLAGRICREVCVHPNQLAKGLLRNRYNCGNCPLSQ